MDKKYILFEYNEQKSATNSLKHGIDFEQAQAMWNDTNLIEVAVSFRDEVRNLVTSRVGEKLWTAVITYREDRVRIISVRRAREDEEKEYYSQGI